jgi:hypothetical protein
MSAVTLCSTAQWSMNATTVAGSQDTVSGSTSTQLVTPTCVFVDNTTAIYVADAGNFRVQRFFPNSTTGVTVINSSSGNKFNQFLSSKHSY